MPLIHVVDETAKVIKATKIEKVGLLGTKFTMEGGFYVERLIQKYELRVFLPSQADRNYIHNAIYNELVQGEFKEPTKKKFLDIIDELSSQGVQGIILGCTEIPLLIKEKDVKIQLFNTLTIHLKGAIEFLD